MSQISSTPLALHAESDDAFSYEMNDWWTDERDRLHRWFQWSAPQLAPVYLGGLRIAMDKSFPGRVHLVAHVIREIGNRLPEAIAGKIEGPNTNYSQLTRAVDSQWDASDLPRDGSLPPAEQATASGSGEEHHTIPRRLLKAISELVIGHRAGSTRNQQKARHLFSFYSQGESLPDYAVTNWLKVVDKHGLAHVRKNPLKPEYEETITEDFLALEQVLLTFANYSYVNMDELDGILESAN